MLSKTGFVGVVVRTTEGGFCAVAKYSIVATNVAIAEAYALLRGCKMVSFLVLTSVIFEFDSLESISCLSSLMEDGC